VARRGQEAAEIRWIVVDAGGAVIHLFSQEARAYYGLEALWQNPASEGVIADV
jgi:ribosomal silencing factor RsfS